MCHVVFLRLSGVSRGRRPKFNGCLRLVVEEFQRMDNAGKCMLFPGRLSESVNKFTFACYVKEIVHVVFVHLLFII